MKNMHMKNMYQNADWLLPDDQQALKLFLFLLVFFFFLLCRAAPLAYGGSQARGRIRATAASLHQSHGNARTSRVCDLHHSSPQRRILNPLSETRDRTHNPVVTGWICFCCTTTGTPYFLYFLIFLQ